MSALSRMLYVSRKQVDTDDHAAMTALMEQAAVNNARNRITGLLTWSEDAFLQLLEGPRSALTELLFRLKDDPRHDGLLLVEFRAAPGRVAQGWAMAAPEPQARAALADLTYERVRTLRPDTLIARLSEVEASTALSIMSQLGADGDVVLV